jgi:UrcA family protein
LIQRLSPAKTLKEPSFICHAPIVGTSSALHRRIIGPPSCRPIEPAPNFILTNRAVRQGQTRIDAMKIITAAIAAVAIIASSVSAVAVAGPVPVNAKVSYADLDLSGPAGQQALERRIKQAARQTCGVGTNERQLALTVDAAQCYRSAVAGAMAEAARINPTMYASR